MTHIQSCENACIPPCPPGRQLHTSIHARQVTIAGGALETRASDLLRTRTRGCAVLKIRCHTNTFKPGDVIPLAKDVLSCSYEAW